MESAVAAYVKQETYPTWQCWVVHPPSHGPQVSKTLQQQFRNFGAFPRCIGSNHANSEKAKRQRGPRRFNPDSFLLMFGKPGEILIWNYISLHAWMIIFTKCEVNSNVCSLVLFENVIIQPKFSYAEQSSTSELILLYIEEFPLSSVLCFPRNNLASIVTWEWPFLNA